VWNEQDEHQNFNRINSKIDTINHHSRW
jgi:hypothetical protein